MQLELAVGLNKEFLQILISMYGTREEGASNRKGKIFMGVLS